MTAANDKTHTVKGKEKKRRGTDFKNGKIAIS